MKIKKGTYTTEQLQQYLLDNCIDRVHVPHPIIDAMIVHCKSDHGEFDLDLTNDDDKYQIINFIKENKSLYIEGIYG